VHRVSEIIGKPLVSAETGDRLGRVSDALLTEGGVKAIAIVLGGGLMGKERVLPFHDIQTLGGDTVLARTESGIRDPGEWRQAGVRITRSSALSGRPAVWADGKRLGEVTDLLINDETGAFDGVEVTVRHPGGFEQVVLSVTDDLRIGPDAVVVNHGALDDRKSS
jgi:uncharacterized protein YrrD